MTQAPEQQGVATVVSNLVITPQVSAVSMSFTTNNAVRGQLQIGTSVGVYTTFKSGVESWPATTHLLNGYGLAAGTLYHYLLNFFDPFGASLDQEADATFTTLAAPTGGAAPGAIIGGLLGGNGVPANSMGSDGNYYFRYDGSAGAYIYHKAGGSWVATAA